MTDREREIICCCLDIKDAKKMPESLTKRNSGIGVIILNDAVGN